MKSEFIRGERMDYKFVELKIENNIATLSLDRAESLNALSLAFTNVQEGMSMAKHKNMVLFTSEDMMEAVAAFMGKRKPDFKGR